MHYRVGSIGGGGLCQIILMGLDVLLLQEQLWYWDSGVLGRWVAQPS